MLRGCSLWGLDGSDSKWEKLHGWLVRSGAGNAVEPQSYSKSVRIPASINQLVSIGISSVDNDGSEHYYGPFEVGQSYGNLNELEPIAWNHIRDQVDAQMSARGYVKDRVHGYRKLATNSAASDVDVQSVVEFRVSTAGVYRISAQSLLNVGIDWREVAKREIALLDHKGEAVVRLVRATGNGSRQSKALGDNGEIIFYVPQLDPTSALYTSSSVYRLVLDRYRSLDAQFQGKRGIAGNYSDFYYTNERVEEDRMYALNSVGNDPWIDTAVLSYQDQPRSYAAAVTVDDDALWHLGGRLTLNMSGSSALRPVDKNADGIQDAEHIVEAVLLADGGSSGLLSLGKADSVGKGIWRSTFEIPGNTTVSLIDGKAVVGGIFNAGSGYAFSEVHVESVELSYARPYTAREGDSHLLFSAPADGASGYEVRVPDSGWPVVFALSGGNLVRMGLESQSRQTTVTGSKERIVRFAALSRSDNTPISYWVSGKRGLLTVNNLTVKSIVSESLLLEQASNADFVIIAHPAFMGASLSNYAQFKGSRGFTVAVVNYLDIVNTFGGGQAGPVGLRRYLSALEQRYNNLAHVLLVGGSSYDHTDKLGSGAVTFIPGMYAQSSFSKFTVTDSLYVMDDSSQMFATIGRWPVRRQQELVRIVNNSMSWSDGNRSQGAALMIAEQTVTGENIDFASALTDMALKLPANWESTHVNVDDVAEQNQLTAAGDLQQAISLARSEIISQLNRSPDLVLYNGHGTTSQLSNKGLFKASDVVQTQSQRSQMWVPMSCYMTYYESTHVNTLSHQLLFAGKVVNIAGAMLLSSQAENIATGNAVIEHTLGSGMSIGGAVNAHKASRNSDTLNVNLTVLGDPTLKM